MKKGLLIVGGLLLSAGAFAQDSNIQRCGTTDYMEYRESIQPGYIQSTADAFEEAKLSQQGNIRGEGDTYRIPVVVHIVYNTENQNLSDEVVFDQIQVLNEDYNRQNADSINLRTDFSPYVGNANIQFELASIDPEGNPTNGITRTETGLETFIDNPLEMLSGGMGQIERVKSTDDGGITPWDQDKYLNIWVCNMEVFGTTFLLGYATPPDNLSNWPEGSVDGMSDGVVLQYQTIGRNNPNPIDGFTIMGRTATHEVGHYLGLRHIWGDGGCTEQDGIDDTPNAADQSQSDCDITKNTCEDDIDGVDLPDMVENYMDYSAETCQNTFTAGQVSLMRGVLENQRWDLVNDNPALALEENKIETVSMFPNPTNSSVTIRTEQGIKRNIVITDLNGKVVRNVVANGTQTVIDIQSLQNGIYQVIIEGIGGASKLVKL